MLTRSADGKELRLARLSADSPLLAHLGSLREHAFRAVGEGTGNACDTDAFDPHYDQLVLWDPDRAEIVGGYRLGHGRELLLRGVRAFYSHTLFDLAGGFAALLDESVELGRSFVLPAHWGSRALDALWFGIGAYLRARPHVRYLFGPVSLSAALGEDARSRIVAYYQRYYWREAPSVAPRLPYLAPMRMDFGGIDQDAAFKLLKSELKRLGTDLPVLYRQYIELTEPGGACFLGFNLDPAFSGAVDGLILVDLAQLKPLKRQRYLGDPVSRRPRARGPEAPTHAR